MFKNPILEKGIHTTAASADSPIAAPTPRLTVAANPTKGVAQGVQALTQALNGILINAWQPAFNLALAEIDARVEMTPSVMVSSDAIVPATRVRVAESVGHTPTLATPAFTVVKIHVSSQLIARVYQKTTHGRCQHRGDSW